MLNPNENKDCYATKVQRKILLQLVAEPFIETNFFLTGGTALSVFYFHHRISNDLDLFTLQQANLSDISFGIKRKWPGESTIIKESQQFLSCLVCETKIDFVIDPLSTDEKRPKFTFENGHCLLIDTIQSIVSNKLCAAVSRAEPKDYVDLYTIFKKIPTLSIDTVYSIARKKDAIFDDPPTAAFQIEEGITFFKEQPDIIPKMLIDFAPDDFFVFCENLVIWLYRQVQP